MWWVPSCLAGAALPSVVAGLGNARAQAGGGAMMDEMLTAQTHKSFRAHGGRDQIRLCYKLLYSAWGASVKRKGGRGEKTTVRGGREQTF